MASIKRHVILLDAAGASTGEWFRLDSRYADGSDNRAVQGTVAGGTVNLEGTTVDTKGGPSLGTDITGNGSFNAWLKGAGWSIPNMQSLVASVDGTQATVTNLSQINSLLEQGATYQVTFTIANYVAGTATPIIAGTAGTPQSANGTFTETIVAGTAGNKITIQGSATLDADISDIQVVLDRPAADIGLLQSYAADFTDVLNSSWTYVRATLDAGSAKVQGNI